MRRERNSQDTAARAALDVEIDEVAGSLRVRDPRAFRPGRRAFCRRLVEAAARQEGVGKVEIDLDAASCRVEFGPASSDRAKMAGAFVEAVRAATSGAWEVGALLRAGEGWSVLSAFPVGEGEVSVWEATAPAEATGQSFLRHRGGGERRAVLEMVAAGLDEQGGVASCRVARWPARLAVDAGGLDPAALVAMAERARAEAGQRETNTNATGVVAGPRRVLYLAAAGGALGMTGVGLVVPGIPTVPFLLATSYYLARSSPALDARLRRSPLLGRVLREWEDGGRISKASKRRLVGLTLVVVLFAVAAAPLSPVALGLIAVMVGISLTGIARMPELPDEPGEAPAVNLPTLAMA